MIYKGYTIISAVQKRYGWKDSHCIGIFEGDKLRAYAVDREIAMRAVDTHTKSGIWPNLEEETKGAVLLWQHANNAKNARLSRDHCAEHAGKTDL